MKKSIIIFILTIAVVCSLSGCGIKDDSVEMGNKYTEENLFDENMMTYTKDNIPDKYLSYDFDSDGLKNEDEIKYGTNMYKSDTDDDGITDKDEIDKTKTNPTVYDSQEKGICDLDWYMAKSDNFKQKYSSNESEYKVYINEPKDINYVLQKESTNSFNDLNTITEVYKITKFNGKIMLDCSNYTEDVANSISIYILKNNKPEKANSTVENNCIIFTVSDGDIFCSIYTG